MQNIDSPNFEERIPGKGLSYLLILLGLLFFVIEGFYQYYFHKILGIFRLTWIFIAVGGSFLYIHRQLKKKIMLKFPEAYYSIGALDRIFPTTAVCVTYLFLALVSLGVYLYFSRPGYLVLAEILLGIGGGLFFIRNKFNKYKQEMAVNSANY